MLMMRIRWATLLYQHKMGGLQLQQEEFLPQSKHLLNASIIPKPFFYFVCFVFIIIRKFEYKFIL